MNRIFFDEEGHEAGYGGRKTGTKQDRTEAGASSYGSLQSIVVHEDFFSLSRMGSKWRVVVVGSDF
jgi:hypothetical protein